MSHFFYMVRCRDASIYSGIAEDVPFRVAQHNAGVDPGCYTITHRPVKLIYTEEYATKDGAFRRERQVKGWSRAKKEALVGGNFERLRWLSRSYADRVGGYKTVETASHPERESKGASALPTKPTELVVEVAQTNRSVGYTASTSSVRSSVFDGRPFDCAQDEMGLRPSR